MDDDVKQYYGFIVLIFFIVKFFLFFVLWSWLRFRVTERMIALTNKLKTNDQSEKRNVQAALNNQPMTGEHRHFNQQGEKNTATSLHQATQEDVGLTAADRKLTTKVRNVGGKNHLLALLDHVVQHKENPNGNKAAHAPTSKQANTTKTTKVTINEIDELEVAMDLLFGE